MTKIKRSKIAIPHPKFFIPRLSIELIGGIIIFVLAASLFIWRLASLTYGQINYHEHTTNLIIANQTSWWKIILNINGPYYLTLYVFRLISHDLVLFRLVSVMIGILTAVVIYWLVSQWHGYKIGLMTAAIYITDFGVLSITRQASPLSASLLIPLGLLASMMAINRWQDYRGLLALSITTGLLLYIPGALWLVLAISVLNIKKLKIIWRDLSIRQRLIITTSLIILLIPLGYQLGHNYTNHQLAYWLGYGLNGKITALKSYGLNLIKTPSSLFFYSTTLPASLSLGHLPLLPIAITVLSLIGFYCYITRLSNYRWLNIIFLFVISWVVISFGVLSVYVLLPLAAIAAGTGLAFMLREWYSVFPRNPYARYAGISLIIAIVAFTCIFSLRSYFVAWANDPATQINYSFRLH